MAFGANLKRERELRAISLEEISKATKISMRLLRAIEMDRYDILPESIFRKSFIKSYAKYLGMNEDKVLQEYIVATQSASPPSTEEKSSRRKSYLKPPDNVRWVIPGFVVLLIVLAIYWYLAGPVEKEKVQTVDSSAKPTSALPTQGLSSPTSSQPAVNPRSNSASPNTGVAVAPPQTSVSRLAGSSRSQLKVLGELAKKPEPAPAEPQNPAPGVPAVSPPGSPATELTLGIDATEKCWVSVSSGDSPLYSGFLEPEQSKKFPIQKRLRLTFGNAGGVRLSVNGRRFASIGKTGEVRVLEINPENYQRYLEATQ
jgi:cytoskeleton protein RodZ